VFQESVLIVADASRNVIASLLVMGLYLQ